jgi:hypothetical protein
LICTPDYGTSIISAAECSQHFVYVDKAEAYRRSMICSVE